LYLATRFASSAPSSTFRDVTQAHHRAMAIGHDQVGELLGGAKVGVREQVHLDQVALGLADGSQIVVALERGVDVAGREIHGREPVGSIQTRIAMGWPPSLLLTRCTPSMVASCGCRVRDNQSVSSGTVFSVRSEAQVERGVGPIGAAGC
jgi:hypothetical protein